MLSVAFAVVSCGAGVGAIVLTDDSNACDERLAVQDSISSNRSRLRSTDSLLLHFDFSQFEKGRRSKGLSVDSRVDSVRTKAILQRNIVALRAQGADINDIREYLIGEALEENPVGFSPDSAKHQLASIHDLEADTLYRQYIKEAVVRDNGIRFKAHDTVSLTNELVVLKAGCTRYRKAMPIMLPLWLAFLGAFIVTWWWWFGGRKA